MEEVLNVIVNNGLGVASFNIDSRQLNYFTIESR